MPNTSLGPSACMSLWGTCPSLTVTSSDVSHSNCQPWVLVSPQDHRPVTAPLGWLPAPTCAFIQLLRHCPSPSRDQCGDCLLHPSRTARSRGPGHRMWDQPPDSVLALLTASGKCKAGGEGRKGRPVLSFTHHHRLGREPRGQPASS